jgi:[ribosomal protein S18]-alanine N-acetyltransferase
MVVIAYPAVEIRAMRHEDLAKVTVLENASYPFPWTIGIFGDCLHAGHSCWVLCCEGEITGYGVLSIAAGEAHVLNICIDAALRGCGLGRRLMCRLLDVARQEGAERVFLEVRPSNSIAQALYHSLCFVPVGRRPHYYPSHDGREDAIVMALEFTVGQEKQDQR